MLRVRAGGVDAVKEHRSYVMRDDNACFIRAKAGMSESNGKPTGKSSADLADDLVHCQGAQEKSLAALEYDDSSTPLSTSETSGSSSVSSRPFLPRLRDSITNHLLSSVFSADQDAVPGNGDDLLAVELSAPAVTVHLTGVSPATALRSYGSVDRGLHAAQQASGYSRFSGNGRQGDSGQHLQVARQASIMLVQRTQSSVMRTRSSCTMEHFGHLNGEQPEAYQSCPHSPCSSGRLKLRASNPRPGKSPGLEATMSFIADATNAAHSAASAARATPRLQRVLARSIRYTSAYAQQGNTDPGLARNYHRTSSCTMVRSNSVAPDGEGTEEEGTGVKTPSRSLPCNVQESSSHAGPHSTTNLTSSTLHSSLTSSSLLGLRVTSHSGPLSSTDLEGSLTPARSSAFSPPQSRMWMTQGLQRVPSARTVRDPSPEAYLDGPEGRQPLPGEAGGAVLQTLGSCMG